VLKRAFSDRDGKLSVPARLSAGACAGMTATLVRCVLAEIPLLFQARTAIRHPTRVTLLLRNTVLQTPCMCWGREFCAQEYSSMRLCHSALRFVLGLMGRPERWR
jgi:hypothetical protein